MSTHTAIATTSKGCIGAIQVPTEKPGEGEVLIKVAFASIVPFDGYVVDRGFYVEKYPVIIGLNAAGTITQVGAGVGDLKIGDRVIQYGIAESRNKAMQEYCVQRRTLVAKIPDSLPFEEAVTIPNNFVTIFYTIFNQLGLPIPSSFPATISPPLSSVPFLVYGAGSTCGTIAIQILNLAGYKKIVTTSSKKHHEHLRLLGATDTFDYNSPSLVDDIAKAVGGDGKILLAVDCITTESTLEILGEIMDPKGKLAILLPIKEGGSVTTSHDKEMYMEVRKDKTPFPQGTEIIGVRTFLFQQDEYLKNNLMSSILPDLLKSGYIQPNRVRLMDKGTFVERVGAGLALLIGNKISGEKVVVKLP